MSEKPEHSLYRLSAPWDSDQMALNAAEILDEVKRQTGRYVELGGAGVWCDCTPGRRRRLVRAFAGPDDSGCQRRWLLAAAMEIKGRHVPPLCVPVPRAGELSFTLHTICPRCRRGWVIFPGGAHPAMTEARAAGDTIRLVFRAGRPSSAPMEEGDETQYLEGSVWAAGPLDSAMLRVEPPILGVLRP